MKYALLIACILLSAKLPLEGANSEAYSLEFSTDSLLIQPIVLNKTTYLNINYGNLTQLGEPGTPAMPAKIINFSVPYNSTNFSVSAQAKESETTAIKQLPYPIQEPQKTDYSETPVTNPNPTFYASTKPTSIADIIGVNYCEGINKTVSVAVYPVQYDAFSSTLIFNNHVNLSLNWSLSDNLEDLNPRPIFSNNIAAIDSSVVELKKMVVNPSKIERNKTYITTYTSDNYIDEFGSSPAEYMIVTNGCYAQAFERLADFRRTLGYTAKVVKLEDILSCQDFADGDVISGINDDAGKLRSFLTYAYSKLKTKYVLLGGSIPYRYGVATNYSDKIKIDYKYIIPTDLYYGELNDTWNTDGDIYYGENGEINDYNCELYVGRLTCASVNDVYNYIDKLYRYERNPGNGQSDYVTKAYTAIHDDLKNAYLNHVKNLILQLYADTTYVYQNGAFPSGEKIISDLNSTSYGFVDLQGHGDPYGVTMTYKESKRLPAYGVLALNNEKPGQYVMENNNSLDCLSNITTPNWSYSISCTLMPYDDIELLGFSTPISWNFGESYVLGKDYGGVAFLGDTRYGYITTSNIMFGNFLSSQLKARTLLNTSLPIGILEAQSKSNMYSNILKGSIEHHVKLTHNILGDPLICPWLFTPAKFSYNILYIQDSPANYVYNGKHTDNFFVGYRNLGDETSNSRTKLTSTRISYKNVLPNTLMTVYGAKTIPNALPLELQNINFNTYKFIDCAKVTIGSSVNHYYAKGEVRFKSGTDLNINSTEDVKILAGTHIESNAALNIKAEKGIEINDVKFYAQSASQFTSSHVIISGPVLFEKGATFRINHH